jgi:eukaryotic-like serine/threonine-protein kinase
MKFHPGARLGSFEVTGTLGAGGMGEVYRATDTNLGRQVAIKILPDAFAQDPERVARFEREAKTLASLNHPNIAIIHGLEKSPGTYALVMELIEGEDLSQRIARGPIPIDEALPIAKQIAEALEAAHEQGVIHRDLKPANIKVREDGTVKVLDFGLAKLLGPAEAGPSVPKDVAAGFSRPDASASPTITSPAMMTGVGVLLGTAAYMSPEQAKGRAADKRSDIWAFGCVLYEMLTTKRAFAGDDVSETIASVLARESDWTALPPTVAPTIKTLLRRCLEKDRRKRIADMSTVLFLLNEHASLGDTPTSAPPPSLLARHRVATTVAVVALVTAAFAMAGAVWVMTSASGSNTKPIRFVITTRVNEGPRPGIERGVAISPDGTRIVFRSNSSQLMTRAIDSLDVVALPGTDGASSPFFSPDGQWVGFFSRGELKKVALSGGPSVSLCRITGNLRGATWGTDGTVVFASTDPATGLLSVSSAGGNPQVLTKPDRGNDQTEHLYPAILPGARYVLFTIAPPGQRMNTEGVKVGILDRTTGQSQVLVRSAAMGTAQYVPPGYLVYATGTSLSAVRFDLDSGTVMGDATPVLDQVSGGQGLGSQFAVSDTGTIVYLPVGAATGSVSTPRSVVWVERDGQERTTSWPIRAYTYPRMSPDGSRIAFDIRDQDSDIWIGDVARQTLTRLTFDRAADFYPVWTPDSRSILFESGRGGSGGNIFRQAADGTGPVEQLTASTAGAHYTYSISPDGNSLVSQDSAPETGIDLALLRLRPMPVRAPLIRSMFGETNGEISPDGRWIAYQSNDSGREEVYVRPFPDVDRGRWQVSTDGGTRPLWARNGRELFYLDQEDLLTNVTVQTEPTFVVSRPVRLLKTHYYSGFGGIQGGTTVAGRTYDVSPDGKRFLMLKDVQRDDTMPVGFVVIVNWSEELKRLLPAK